MIPYPLHNQCVMCVSAVAERLVLKQKYPVDLDTEVTVKVGPVYRHELRKFQVRLRLVKAAVESICLPFYSDDSQRQCL